MSEYQGAHRRACCAAITALGNRIGLFAGSTRVGTAYADTTWTTPVDINEAINPAQPVSGTNPAIDKAASTGSLVTISVPGGTVANGTVINRYGVFNGATLLRTEALPVSLTVNDGSQPLQVDVTPTFKFWGV
ncbi:hypothetical protein [Mycobacteroides abscessus]|uniref:hypothetical protein n=1 Tax=Mycobacteroides abscessus TaxID=36809 RepID=UPI00078CF298|nr:hypothetical protein [Mycobacteroides abscessus]AMU76963.1 hypothetical protein A3O06_22155 [Mycobacteroides abscessus]ANO25909.1 hypothetical protein BAB79_22150 [Mycobacteroides abscessus]